MSDKYNLLFAPHRKEMREDVVADFGTCLGIITRKKRELILF